jgi:rfaE bifunctional protein nucleotidyltransferase chain/domain
MIRIGWSQGITKPHAMECLKLSPPKHPKIVDLFELSKICRHRKSCNQKVVLCHGCFDLFHFGHLRHFQAAKQMGDVLVVTVTPDRFINKGPDRPVFPEEARVEFIAALEIVDFVALNRWPSAVETIRLVQPALFVKGSEYRVRDTNTNTNIYLEEKAVCEVGGSIAYTDEITFSSTTLLSKYFGVAAPENQTHKN